LLRLRIGGRLGTGTGHARGFGDRGPGLFGRKDVDERDQGHSSLFPPLERGKKAFDELGRD